MTEEKTCYNCGRNSCNVKNSIVIKDCKRHFEVFDLVEFDCINHDKWLPMDNKKGFYVFNPGREKPRYIHETLEKARVEAERLAKLNPTETFEVLEIINRYDGALPF